MNYKDFVKENINDYKSNRWYFSDPTTMGVNFRFSSDSSSPLLNETNMGESAIKYLESIGEDRRRLHLLEFKRLLTELTEEYPYYIQTVSGLNGMLIPDTINARDERTLVINTLEGLDQRIARMVIHYSKAVYDFEYRRIVLPENLRWVSYEMIISEIRNIKSFIEETESNDPEEYIQNINDKLVTYIYRFYKSEFDFTGSNAFLGNIDNAKATAIEGNTFSLICPYIKDISKLGVYEVIGTEQSNNIDRIKLSTTTNNNLKALLKKQFTDELNNIKKQLIQGVKNRIQSQLEFFKRTLLNELNRLKKDNVFLRSDKKKKIKLDILENFINQIDDEEAREYIRGLILGGDIVNSLNNADPSIDLSDILVANLGNVFDR